MDMKLFIEALSLHERIELAYELRPYALPAPTQEEAALWRVGRKVPALKAYRKRTGNGLAETVAVLRIYTGIH